MRTPSGHRLTLLTVTALVLAACTGQTAEPDDGTDARLRTAATGAITLRVWDEAAAAAYVESFEAFSTQFPSYSVEVEVVPAERYAGRLTADLREGDAPDLFWVDPTTLPALAGSDALVDAGAVVGDDHDAWLAPVTDLFTVGSDIWAVPQLWQSVALFYDVEKVDAAGIEPGRLTWAPAGAEGDTLLSSARLLTVDPAGRHPGEDGFDVPGTTTWGFNAVPDVRSLVAPFLAQNGARLDDGEGFGFATPEGDAAVQYLVDMSRAHAVAPPADVAPGPTAARDLFTQGRLAMLQAGSDDLRAISDARQTPVGVAPMVAGPQGRFGVVGGVGVAASAGSDQQDAVTAALGWLGSAAGQAALASQGLGLPAVTAAQDLYAEYWAGRDVDVTALLDAVREPPLPGPSRVCTPETVAAMEPPLGRVFRGETTVTEGLEQAQAAADAAFQAAPTPTASATAPASAGGQ